MGIQSIGILCYSCSKPICEIEFSESGVGETGVGEIGVGETRVGEIWVGETGVGENWDGEIRVSEIPNMDSVNCD